MAQADSVIAEFEGRIAAADRAVANLPRKRVACLEWLDPPYAAGHWVPEMVERAGGVDVLGRPGKPAARADWDAILAARPEVIVVMPCGYSLEQAVAEFRQLALPPGWDDTPAVRNGCVFLVEASGYFSRPGPRLAAGVEILAEAIHSARTVQLTPHDSKGLFTRVAASSG
jgi:iron complex transport system substrate-binding protein